MHESANSHLTELLNQGFGGDAVARDRAFALVYDELRRTAAAQMGSGRDNATLSPTGLVNEAYLKLVSGAQLALNDRGHFFALAARAMRQLLIDQQRLKQTNKHGGAAQRVEIGDDLVDAAADPVDYLDLDRALQALDAIDPRAAKVVELHFFAGLNFMEIAELLAVADKTVRRDWNSARAFLLARIALPDVP